MSQPPPSATEAEPPGRTKAGESYGRRTIHGAVWAILASVTNQGLSFLSLLILGWVLLRDDFGVYAPAAGFANMIVVLRNGGMHRVLVQRAREFHQLAPLAYRIALGFNLAAACIIAIGGVVLARLFNEPQLVPMLAIVAISLPIQSSTVVYRARLMTSLEYRSVSQLDASASLVRYLTTIGFALAGLGPLSFVLPMPIVSFFEWLRFRRAAGPLPTISDDPASADGGDSIPVTTPLTAHSLLADSFWVIVGTVTLAVILNSDKLVIRSVQPGVFAGIYLFGQQLMQGLTRPLVTSLPQVLMPTLSRMADDRKRQAMAFVRIGSALVLCGAIMSFGIFTVGEPLVHVLWSGKWDESIPVLRVFACALPLLFFSAASVTLIESRGRWRELAWIQGTEGLLTSVAAYFGALTGSLMWTAVTIALMRVFVALFKYLRACRLLELSPAAILAKAVPALLLPLVAAIMALALVPTAWNPWIRLFALGTIYTALIAVSCLTVLRPTVLELWSYLPSRIRKKFAR